MTRTQLIILGYKIVRSKGTEQEIDEMIALFNKNVPHPNGANLFFYPENYNARTTCIVHYNPSVEEVVDLAMNYKQISL